MNAASFSVLQCEKPLFLSKESSFVCVVPSLSHHSKVAVVAVFSVVVAVVAVVSVTRVVRSIRTNFGMYKYVSNIWPTAFLG